MKDSISKLEWQDGYINNIIKKSTWREALIYCNELTLGGYNDWRLPNRNELLSIVDNSRNPAILGSVFTKIASNYYWSSSTVVSNEAYANTSHAWYIHFRTGSTGWQTKTLDNINVRCVRGGI